MKILLLDHDQPHADQICKILETQGHSPISVSSWDEALKELGTHEYSIALLDYKLLPDSKGSLEHIRRVSRRHMYVIGMDIPDNENAIQLGFNSVVSDIKALETVIETASLFFLRITQLADATHDFPSAGGVISKSAFNQLFMSSMDLSRRDGKEAYVLFFSIENYKNIVAGESEYSARHAAARLAHHLSQTRRQSDILAQVDDNEYAILFLRPDYGKEPIEATKRFAKTLAEIKDYTMGVSSVDIALRLHTLPSGHLEQEESFTVQS